MNKLTSLIIITLVTTLLGCDFNNKNAEQIPLEDFFKNPEKTYFKISPNGKYISYTAPWKNRMNLFIQEIGVDTSEQITFEDQRDIAGYIWANDTRLLFVKDENGNENYKLYAVNIDGSDFKCLTCFEGVKLKLIDDLQEFPNEIIVGLNQRDSTVFDPYRLNIVSGEMKMLAQNPGNIIRWVTDHNGKLRLAVAVEGGVNHTLLYRDSENDNFNAVLKTSWREEVIPQFFTFDNKMIYALSNKGRDKMEVVIFDPKSRTETAVLYKNKDVDISGLSYSKKNNKLTTANYTTEKKQTYFFDTEFEDHYNILRTKLKGEEIWISSMNLKEDVFIVRTYSDKSRGAYYIYNTTNESLEKISDISPWIDENKMAEMKPIRYTSRDGLTIHGYLTLPKGARPKNLPVVVLPHGGPWTRDYWGFNPEVQFFANRGYAVLQMNYRGSTGYGKEFWLKSVKQWGANIQNDITDGVHWLIEEGIADKNRIAIYGASFGGYAALAGITFTPDLYACGIDYVGPSNLFTFMNTLPTHWQPMQEMFYELVGDPVKDSLLLAKASPALHVDRIKVPVFIAQGAQDPRVNKAESDQMVEAMIELGLEVEYMVKDNEGHGFKNEENRFALYAAMEVFLGKHLGSEDTTN